MTRPIFGKTQRRRQVLDSTTVRDFSGGLNIIDNELNLSSKYARVLDNILRLPDGSLGVRWGTEFIVDVNAYSNIGGSLPNNPASTVDTTSVVTITHTNHPFISGHKVTLAGLVDTGGITAAQLNTTHVVTYVNANSYTIATAGTATSTVTGGGSSGTFVYNNQTLGADVVGMTYATFAGEGWYIVVGKNGKIIAIRESTGQSILIWDTDIAAKLTGGPTGWTDPTTFVSFCQVGADSPYSFASAVIVTNGFDKPIEINLNRTPTAAIGYTAYLVNPGGSNVFIPRARYCTVIANYLVLAGGYEHCTAVDIPANTKVWIAREGSKGCFVSGSFNCGGGATEETDATCMAAGATAIVIDIRRYVTAGDVDILGIGEFRGRLIISCEQVVILAQLGILNATGAHTPSLNDIVVNYGTVGHHTMMSIGDDYLLLDYSGVSTLSRSQLVDTVKPYHVSSLIDPEIQVNLRRAFKDGVSRFTKTNLLQYCWAVYNKREQQYMLFIPDHPDPTKVTEYIGYIYTVNVELKVKSWSRFRGLKPQCGMSTALGDVIFAEGTKLYVYGSVVKPITADRIGDPAIDSPDDGEGIAFVWETPWSDFGERFNIKQTRFLGLDTIGESEFSAAMFVDNFYESVDTGALGGNPVTTVNGSDEITIAHTAHGASDGDEVYLEGIDTVGGIDESLINKRHKIHSSATNSYKVTVEADATSGVTGGGASGRYNFVILSPSLELLYKGGSSWGYGGPFSTYGGGRVTRDERLMAWPAKGKLFKLRFSGESTNELRFVAFTLAFMRGGIRI